MTDKNLIIHIVRSVIHELKRTDVPILQSMRIANQKLKLASQLIDATTVPEPPVSPPMRVFYDDGTCEELHRPPGTIGVKHE